MKTLFRIAQGIFQQTPNKRLSQQSTTVYAIKMAKAGIASALLLFVAGCATSPTGRSTLYLFPEGQMSQMGVQAYQEIKQQQKVSTSRRANNYVNCVTNAITAQLPGDTAWEVTVFDDDSANAFALPGGKIGVHTGLLDVAKNQSQLAAVIGHEIEHVRARHGNERMSQSQLTGLGVNVLAVLAGEAGISSQQNAMALLGLGAQVGLLLPFSRAQESEADVLGLAIMARAGFDPRESIRLWENMATEGGGNQPAEFMSTHPSHGTRISDLRANMPQAMALYEQARAQGRRPRCK